MKTRLTFDDFLEEEGIKEEVEQMAEEEMLRLKNRPWYIKVWDKIRC